MTQLCRLKVTWAGAGATGGGLSTFYTSTAGSGFPAAVLAFFNFIKGSVPDDVTWTVPDNGDLIEDTDGTLAGTWADTGTGGSVTGTVATEWAAGSGARVRWITAGIRHGRRVTGTTFMVPLATGTYTNGGLLTSTFRGDLTTAANTLRGAVPLRVRSRNTRGTSDGTSHAVTAVQVPNAVTQLRSRRT